jgi:hypothetical protein
MNEITMESLPSGVWFWRKESKHRWVIPGPGRWACKLDSATPAELMSNPNEIVLIDPNWCHVCYQQLLWPPNVMCPACGDNSNIGKTLEELKSEVGEWVGISREFVHI